MRKKSEKEKVESELEERERSGGTLGSMLPRIDPFVPRADHHNPRELRSWAKRTGFVSNFSSEAPSERNGSSTSSGLDLEKGFRGHRGGGSGSSPKIEIDPILGRTRPNRGAEIEAASLNGNGGVRDNGFGRRVADNGNGKGNESVDGGVSRIGNGNGNGNGGVSRIGNENGNGVGMAVVDREVEAKKEDGKAQDDLEVNVNAEGDEQEHVHGGGDWRGPFGIKCGLRENPGFG